MIRAPLEPQLLKKGTFVRLVLAFMAFLVLALGFVQVAIVVRQHGLLRYDALFLTWLHQWSAAWLDSIFIFFTTLGDIVLLLSACVVVSSYLLYHRQRRAAVLLLFSVGGAVIINIVLKLVFQRPRPDLWQQLVVETGYSFPSGHAMASSAFALALIILLWHTRWRLWALGVGLVMTALVGLSRLYLGVHYPTDVMAGWFISMAWVFIVAGLIARFGSTVRQFLGEHRQKPPS